MCEQVLSSNTYTVMAEVTAWQGAVGADVPGVLAPIPVEDHQPTIGCLGGISFAFHSVSCVYVITPEYRVILS